MRRDTKEVLAELVGKLKEKLDPKKVAATSAGERDQRGELRPNLDRLTVGVDLGDQWSHYCILGLEGETLVEGQLRTTQEDIAEFFQALNAARVVFEVGTHSPWVQEVICSCRHEVLVANPRLMEGSKRRKRKNDRIDAHKLARLGRVDPQSLHPMQHRSREVRQDLVVLRARDVFTAEAPAGMGQEKYDVTTASMIALLRYGSGFRWNRLADLQESMGIPLPVATQCEIVAETATTLQPAMEELIRQAAQGEVLHNDDTSMPVLALRRKQAMDTDEEEGDAPERTGVFTSGIVSTAQKQTIALFFTGRQHAGENLADVLQRRAAELAPPLQMCDALSRNLPKLPEKLEVIVGHCLAHARRRFVEVTPNFPEPCQHVLEQLGKIYGNDAVAREQTMTPEERLRFHQRQSAPVMDQLHIWLTAQFAEKKVEPNSGLGVAMRYLLKHWERLTLFLRQPGAPLDNNICERALKKAILHRKNSLFYKTENGAHVGDLFMSLIHTCELSDANPFDYLTQLQRHAGELARNPSQWMPWNYPATLEAAGARLDSG